jgi:hypothetical protein
MRGRHADPSPVASYAYGWTNGGSLANQESHSSSASSAIPAGGGATSWPCSAPH